MLFINTWNKKLLPLLMMGFALHTAPLAAAEKESLKALPSHYDMIVAYYGRPNVKTMGILGEYPLAEIIQKVQARAAAYEKALEKKHHVTAGIDLVYEMATSTPEKDGKYVITLSEKTLMDYIQAAQKNGLVLFIDVQLGKKSPAEAVKPLLKYLKYDNVHIAVDPEFSVDDLNTHPGEKIGSITGKQINAVQDLISSYLKQNNLPDKILMLHMFTAHMITGAEAVRYTPQVHLVMHLDGHGSPALKIKTYNEIYSKVRASQVPGGFKVFLKEDKPVMTPRQVLGLESIQNAKVRDMPRVITYQ